MDISAAVVAVVFSVAVAVRELSEPDAVVLEILISVAESRGMLLVVEGVWAKISEIAWLATGVNIPLGGIGMGVALLMKEV